MTHPRRNIKRNVHEERLERLRKGSDLVDSFFFSEIAHDPALDPVYMAHRSEFRSHHEDNHTIDIPHEEVTPKQLPPKA